MDSIRVAAIQMRATVGAVASNLSHAESLVREAFQRRQPSASLTSCFGTQTLGMLQGLA